MDSARAALPPPAEPRARPIALLLARRTDVRHADVPVLRGVPGGARPALARAILPGAPSAPASAPYPFPLEGSASSHSHPRDTRLSLAPRRRVAPLSPRDATLPCAPSGVPSHSCPRDVPSCRAPHATRRPGLPRARAPKSFSVPANLAAFGLNTVASLTQPWDRVRL
jgi:hypothetical protein